MSAYRLAGLVLVIWSLAPSLAAAQPFGTFRWQVLPYCNVITVAITQNGAVYRLEGTDDQCGAPVAAALTGLAFINPNGSVGMGFTIIAAPGGAPVAVDATVDLSGSGTWRDSAGNTGPLVLTPGAGTGGAPRPVGGGVGGAAVNPTQVQLRVTGSCAAGAAVSALNQDGSVTCQSTGAGDITAVTAGPGLKGGQSAGPVVLEADFAGSGAATTVARSDHSHPVYVSTRDLATTWFGSGWVTLPTDDRGASGWIVDGASKLVTFTASCAMGGANFTGYIDIDILQNDVPVASTSGAQHFCTANGSDPVDGWVRSSITAQLPAVTGVNGISVRARIIGAATFTASAWLASTSLVIQ